MHIHANGKMPKFLLSTYSYFEDDHFVTFTCSLYIYIYTIRLVLLGSYIYRGSHEIEGINSHLCFYIINFKNICVVCVDMHACMLSR